MNAVSNDEAGVRALHDAYVGWQKNPKNTEKCPINQPGWNHVGVLLKEIERLRQRIMLNEIKDK